jgi:ABC-type uncharacterized transport system substrate-binding protein
VKRREFITLIGAAASPFSARAQQAERMRLVGILLPIGKDDPDYRPWISAFRQGLQGLGWIEGRNVRFDIRWATNNPGEIRTQAAELAALAPDVILAPGTSTVGPLMQATRTLITFVHFSISSAMNLPNSAGVLSIGSTPKAMRRAFRVGLATPALISAFSLSTTAVGVPIGTQIPNQPTAT